MEHNTPRFALGYIYPNQTQKEFLINEALAKIDSLLLPSVVSRSLTTPPSEAHGRAGEMYIIPKGAGDAWSWPEGTNYLILAIGGNWVWIKPQKGMFLWVCDEMKPCVYDGSSWRSINFSYSDSFFGL